MDFMLDPLLSAFVLGWAAYSFLTVLHMRADLVAPDTMSRIKFLVYLAPVTIAMVRFSAAHLGVFSTLGT